MAIKRKNNDTVIHTNRGNGEHDENERLNVQPSREGLRPRICASQLRRFHFCTCGRPRALIRHGRRWHRLGTCRHCLAPPAAIAPTATCSNAVSNARKAVEHA
jgi:hypothetical protein